MTTLTEGAFAKINLTLDVLDRREDGYHDIRSILQTVALRDDIELLLDTGTGWHIECETAGIPLDETNLAWRAARVFFDTFGGEPDGLTIRITKRIPPRTGCASHHCLRKTSFAFKNRRNRVSSGGSGASSGRKNMLPRSSPVWGCRVNNCRAVPIRI